MMSALRMNVIASSYTHVAIVVCMGFIESIYVGSGIDVDYCPEESKRIKQWFEVHSFISLGIIALWILLALEWNGNIKPSNHTYAISVFIFFYWVYMAWLGVGYTYRNPPQPVCIPPEMKNLTFVVNVEMTVFCSQLWASHIYLIATWWTSKQTTT